MRLSSEPRCSLHSEGFQAVLVRSIPLLIMMKFAVFFLVCFVALAAAAPQLLTTYPGYLGPAVAPIVPRTLVTGPTVINGIGPYGARIIAPGYIGTPWL